MLVDEVLLLSLPLMIEIPLGELSGMSVAKVLELLLGVEGSLEPPLHVAKSPLDVLDEGVREALELPSEDVVESVGDSVELLSRDVLNMNEEVNGTREALKLLLEEALPVIDKVEVGEVVGVSLDSMVDELDESKFVELLADVVLEEVEADERVVDVVLGTTKELEVGERAVVIVPSTIMELKVDGGGMELEMLDIELELSDETTTVEVECTEVLDIKMEELKLVDVVEDKSMEILDEELDVVDKIGSAALDGDCDVVDVIGFEILNDELDVVEVLGIGVLEKEPKSLILRLGKMRMKLQNWIVDYSRNVKILIMMLWKPPQTLHSNFFHHQCAVFSSWWPSGDSSTEKLSSWFLQTLESALTTEKKGAVEKYV